MHLVPLPVVINEMHWNLALLLLLLLLFGHWLALCSTHLSWYFNLKPTDFLCEWVSEWVKERSLCRPPTSRGCNWLRLRLQTRGRSGLQLQRMLMSMTRQLPDSTGNSYCCAWGVAAVVVDSSPHLRPEALQMSCNCSCSWFTCNLIKCHRFFRFIRQ